ncbi:MAG: hypothetical protein LAQ69_14355 [Acidobacteriia bacterium]|nr:hypothetical protein [Terriglobia bacterium]
MPARAAPLADGVTSLRPSWDTRFARQSFGMARPPTAGARRAREMAATAKPRISIHRMAARRRRRMADLDGLARCDAEIASAEALLLAGHPDIQGLLLALSDWTQEKRLIQDESDCSELTK